MKAFLLSSAMLLLAGPSLAQPSAGQPVAPQVLQGEIPESGGLRFTEVLITFAPGLAIPAHRHGAFVTAYVVRGAVTSQVEGEPVRTYRVGEGWTEVPGAHHVLARNSSDTEPAELLVVFVARKGAVLTIPDH